MSRPYDAGVQRAFDVVVVGAGPAGMAATVAAASRDLRVAVLDDNPAAGGQIWREGHGNSQKDPARDKVLGAFRTSGAELFPGCQVANASRDGWLQVWDAATQAMETFRFDKLVLATGARERFLPFPGWTLPGVFGAGGLQALVRGGFNVRGKRVIVAGTGPLLLAVAAHLREDGAEIVVVAEQASLGSLLSFAPQLLRRPGKLLQGAQLRASLGGASYCIGNWPVEAEGSTKLTAVRLTDGRKTWTEACDLLACGFHLVPNTELASLLGCDVGESGVVVDANQLTTVQNIYCAGESTGIAGVDSAMVEGEIAGLAAAGDTASVLRLSGRRDAERGFGLAMSKAFALREELKKLAQPSTIVCRCEDVRYRDIIEHSATGGGWTNAKLQTRCGMGPCQARICGPALETLFGWRNASVRPPLFPVPVSALCDIASATENELQPIPQELKR